MKATSYSVPTRVGFFCRLFFFRQYGIANAELVLSFAFWIEELLCHRSH
jgi:hypothetical protein